MIKFVDWLIWLLFVVLIVVFVIAVHLWFTPILSTSTHSLSLSLLIAALVPAFLVAQHGIYLFRFKARTIRRALSSPKKRIPDNSPVFDLPGVQFDQNINEIIGDAAHQTIILYFIIAGALAIVATVLFSFSFADPNSLPTMIERAPSQQTQPAKPPGADTSKGRDEGAPTIAKFSQALRLSAAGAFIYVLIVLGKRNFQRDITPGLACWCLVQLVLGPALGCTLAYFLLDTSPPSNGISNASGAASSIGIGTSVLYFFAGLSPRLVADLISETAARMWPGASPHQNIGIRVVPLGLVRGITRSVEDRLLEEGIEDTLGLSLSNPLRLMRNTPYDARLILGWIDEAYLITTLPQHWQSLENEGVTGAMDLAWYAGYDGDEGAEDKEDDDSNDEHQQTSDNGIVQDDHEQDQPVNNQADQHAPVEKAQAVPPNQGEKSSDAKAHGNGKQHPPTAVGLDANGNLALTKDPITKLADRINMRRDALREVVFRLADDSQVALVWALFGLGQDDESVEND